MALAQTRLDVGMGFVKDHRVRVRSACSAEQVQICADNFGAHKNRGVIFDLPRDQNAVACGHIAKHGAPDVVLAERGTVQPLDQPLRALFLIRAQQAAHADQFLKPAWARGVIVNPHIIQYEREWRDQLCTKPFGAHKPVLDAQALTAERRILGAGPYHVTAPVAHGVG